MDDKLEAEVFEMTNGSERLDRIEIFIEQTAKSQSEMGAIIANLGKSQELVERNLADVSMRLQEMAVRQQYHDEAFERHDAEMKAIKEASAADTERVLLLLRIAELHQRRLDDLEGPTRI